MELLPTGNFGIIYADPPWAWKTRSAKGLDGRPQHYDRMSLREICDLPVASVCAKDAWLFLWTTGPQLPQAFEVMKAWGFDYSGMGFVWVKLNKNAGEREEFRMSDLFMGGGYTTRKNAEFCLLGRRGQPKRLRADVHEVMVAPRREHSRKPDAFYDRIEAFAQGPFLEMFARTTRRGWSSWGNQVGKFGEAA